jgi:hypothetical protein
MNKLIIKELYIFEPISKKAKKVEFIDGVNIITSELKDGNDVGKSIIMKSIYHTLGADCYFDDKWKEDSKVYYLVFSVNKKTYAIYRNQKLFKLYNEKDELIFSTVNRNELSEMLSKVYDFKVLLPNRSEKELVLTPPVFSYVLNYIDQDYMSGTKFASFDSLQQFAGFKENVIYNHFGIFNEEYFLITKEIEELKKEQKKLAKDKELLENMLLRIESSLEGLEAPANLEALNKELEKSKEEYTSIIESLNKLKTKLIKFRNDKIDLEQSINELRNDSNIDLKEINNIRSDFCPTCSQKIERSELVIAKSNRVEDLFILKGELEGILLETERQLKLSEAEYQTYLDKRMVYEKKINSNSTVVSNVLKHMGYIETRDDMLVDLGKVDISIQKNEKDLKKNKNKLKDYNEIKKNANNKYYNHLILSKNYFGLEEIDDTKFESIKSNFTAGGSNKPIATIIWYLALLKVKYQFNGDVIKFPIVLDSPNNVESDIDKKHRLLSFILNNYDSNSQLLLSTLGFKESDYEDVNIDKVITLENPKYHLLNDTDYNQNKYILERIFNE